MIMLFTKNGLERKFLMIVVVVFVISVLIIPFNPNLGGGVAEVLGRIIGLWLVYTILKWVGKKITPAKKPLRSEMKNVRV